MKLKKWLLISSSIGVASTPMATIISCGAENKNSTWYKNGEVEGRKVVAQSFEPIDFLSTFQLKPDYYVTRSDQGVYMDAIPKYLTDKLGNKLNDVTKINKKIRDWGNKQNFNSADMLKDIGGKKGVLLTYQSLHAADAEIKQAFNGVIYDDLGNDSGIGSYPGTIKLGDNYTQPRMYDVVKNYKAFTNSLDKLYGTEYIKQAEANAKKFSDYVKDFNTKNTQLKGKKILFVRPNEKVTDQDSANNIAIWTPLAYNLFYASEENNGLEMEFPKPQDGAWPKSTKDGGYFDPWAINTRNNDTANVSTKVVEEYAGTADYVVYLTNVAAWNNESQNARNFVENATSNVGKLLNTNAQQNPADNIIFADYSKFYRGLYGIVGQQVALQTIATAGNEWASAISGLQQADASNEILDSNATLSKLSDLK